MARSAHANLHPHRTQVLKKHCYLDAILTVVDCKHIRTQLARTRVVNSTGSTRKVHTRVNEALQQICFADRVLINKVDLISPDEADEICKLVRGLNGTAKIFSTTRAQGVAISELIGINAFEVDRHMGLWTRNADAKQVDRGSNVWVPAATHSSALDHNIVTHSICCEGQVDLHIFSQWITELLRTQGDQIFRTKVHLTWSKHVCWSTLLALSVVPHRRVSLPLKGTTKSLFGIRCT